MKPASEEQGRLHMARESVQVFYPLILSVVATPLILKFDVLWVGIVLGVVLLALHKTWWTCIFGLLNSMAVFAMMIACVVAWVASRSGREDPVVEESSVVGVPESVGEREVPVREQLLGARRDSGVLVERLEEALEGRLLKDPDIRRNYQANFSKFSPEMLAALTVSEGAFGGGGVVQKYVATSSDDLSFVHAYFHALDGDVEAKKILLQHLGADSVLLAPDGVLSFLEGLPELSGAEWRALGSGLRSRVRIHTKDPELKLASLNQYLSTIENHEVLRRLAPAAIDLMETDEAIDWLKAGEPAIVGAGDVALMRSLEPDEVDKGFEMINFFIGDGQVKRAQGAIEGWLPAYASRKTDEAFAWVESLDDEVRTNQMRATAFRALYDSDPAEAAAVLEAAEDADVRRLYENHWRAAERARELKEEREGK